LQPRACGRTGKRMPRRPPDTIAMDADTEALKVFATRCRKVFDLLASIRHGERVTEIRVRGRPRGDCINWDDNAS
jgi:hypothetical protein